MNKSPGSLQAELKLVYYGAPFEIRVGKAKHGALFPFFFLLSFVVWLVYVGRKYCDLQA